MDFTGPDKPNTSSTHTARFALLPACTYLILILFMWSPFGTSQGMPYETTFVYMSETSPFLKGFLYLPDPLRIHTNTFYHLSYLLGEALGIGGSFFPYQLVYIMLWLSRGILVFLILYRFLPKNPLFCYLIGALAVVHASDKALLWVGQLNQFGYIFWMLLAMYMLVLAFQNTHSTRIIIFLIFAAFFQYMSLWSYESQILIMLAAPVALLLLMRRVSGRLLAIAGAWYVVPCVYIYLTISRYFYSTAQTYQESILRNDWSVSAIANDLMFNLWASLKFWDWSNHIPMEVVKRVGLIKLSEVQGMILPTLAACVFFAVGIIFVYWQRGKQGQIEDFLPQRRTLWAVLVVGLAFMVLSFPAYLLLNSSRSLWRTQFLSGIGAALVMGSVIGVAASYLRRRWMGVIASLALGALIIFFGTSAAIKLGAFHYRIWENHRQAISQVLQMAPRLKPGSIVVLVNVPRYHDPFGHNMWFDVALRLAYPGTPVAGIYFFDDGSPSPGNNMKLNADEWQWDGSGFPTVVKRTDVSRTVIIKYDKYGDARIQKKIPEFLHPDARASKLYNPLSVVERGPSPLPALRRY
jgi:hypothetical protein